MCCVFRTGARGESSKYPTPYVLNPLTNPTPFANTHRAAHHLGRELRLRRKRERNVCARQRKGRRNPSVFSPHSTFFGVLEMQKSQKKVGRRSVLLFGEDYGEFFWLVLSPRCRRAALECECRFLPCSADFCTNLQKTLLRKIKHRHPPLYYTKPPRCPRPLAGVRSPRKRNRKTPPLAFCIVLGTR